MMKKDWRVSEWDGVLSKGSALWPIRVPAVANDKLHIDSQNRQEGQTTEIKKVISGEMQLVVSDFIRNELFSTFNSGRWLNNE